MVPWLPCILACMPSSFNCGILASTPSLELTFPLCKLCRLWHDACAGQGVQDNDSQGNSQPECPAAPFHSGPQGGKSPLLARRTSHPAMCHVLQTALHPAPTLHPAPSLHPAPCTHLAPTAPTYHQLPGLAVGQQPCVDFESHAIGALSVVYQCLQIPCGELAAPQALTTSTSHHIIILTAHTCTSCNTITMAVCTCCFFGIRTNSSKPTNQAAQSL